MASARAKPRLRILHHLARSGGTLISRCLGSMQNVALFSEVHPDTMKLINPVQQARNWYSLVTDDEIKQWNRRGGPSFEQLFILANYRAESKQLHVVLRDWTHIDYHGLPYRKPTMHPRIVHALQDNFDLLRTATVRHPIDTYLSLMKLPIMQGVPLRIRDYLEGCQKFAEQCVHIGFIRYEDFTRAPDTHLQILCERLELDFDPTYIERWASNDHVTGDVTGTRGGRQEIRPLTRRQVDPRVVEAFRAHQSYHRIKELLGYDED